MSDIEENLPLSQDEITERKRIEKNTQNRERMRLKKLDPEFVKKFNEQNKMRVHKKYINDAEYRQRQIECSKARSKELIE